MLHGGIVRRWWQGLAAGLALVLVAGCVGTDEEIAANARALAEEVVPGTLELLDATRSVSGWVEISYAFLDDPTAAVVIRPHHGRLDAEQLEDAVALARWQAAELRVLQAAMDACEAPVVAIRALRGTGQGELEGGAWIQLPLQEEEVGATVAHLEQCLQDWLGDREAEGLEPELSSLGVRLTTPEVVDQLPPVDPDLPTILQLSDDERQAALETSPHWQVFVTDPGVVPIQYSLVPRGDEEVRAAAEEAATASAAQWLTDNDVDGQVAGALWSHAHLEPHSLARLRLPVRVCPVTDQDCPNRVLEGLVMVTVDLSTLVVDGHALVVDVPRSDGTFPRPLE